MRIYVLLYGVNPMRVYLHNEGMGRFATVPYVSPGTKSSNLNNLFMHLTNYAINKNSENYVKNNEQFDEDNETSHKRSLENIYQHLENEGYDVSLLQDQIKDIIIKTLITGLPNLNHLFKSCQPDDVENQMCF